MTKVAKNSVKKAVKEVAVVEAVKKNLEAKEQSEAVEEVVEPLTFEITRNSHDALDVKFSGKPCREILNRLNEGFTKRSERFNWFNGVWSTFRFNKSKEAEREGKDSELMECKMFIEKIINEPLTMTDEEAMEEHKKARAENRKNKGGKKASSKKSTATTEKSKEKANSKAKKEEEAKELNKKVNAFLKGVGMTRKQFDALPRKAQALVLAGMENDEEGEE